MKLSKPDCIGEEDQENEKVNSLKLQKDFYTYRSVNGKDSQFAISKKRIFSTPQKSRRDHLLLNLNNTDFTEKVPLLTQLYNTSKLKNQINLFSERQVNIQKSKGFYERYQRKKVSRLKSRLQSQPKAPSPSKDYYLSFAMKNLSQLEKEVQVQQKQVSELISQDRLILKYKSTSQETELMTYEQTLIQKPEEQKNEKEVLKQQLNQVFKGRKKSRHNLNYFQDSYIQNQLKKQWVGDDLKKQFREKLGTIQKEQKELLDKRYGPNHQRFASHILQALHNDQPIPEKRIKETVQNWFDEKNFQIDLAEKKMENLQFKGLVYRKQSMIGRRSQIFQINSLKRRGSSVGANIEKADKVIAMKKDLINRFSFVANFQLNQQQIDHLIYQSNKSNSSDNSSSDSDSSNSGSIDQSKKNDDKFQKRLFIKQLLSLVEPIKKKPQQKDEHLKEKMNLYWQFDRKGRNIQELQMRRQRKKLKNYGILFSQSIRENIKKIRESLILSSRKMKIMKISPEELLSEDVILKRPFQREGSYLFFKAIEKQQIDVIKMCITKCRYFVFDIDYQKQTALHIACKKGYLEIVKILINCGSYLDQQDIANRTALYYAAKNNQVKIVQLLLASKAIPWSHKGCDYANSTDNNQILKIFKIARRVLFTYLDIMLLLTPYKNREKIWNKYNHFLVDFKEESNLNMNMNIIHEEDQ